MTPSHAPLSAPASTGTDPWGFDDDGPTVEQCTRLWHDGIALQHNESIFHVCEGAKLDCSDKCEHLGAWIESVRLMRSAGLFDTELSYFLMYSITRESVEWEADAWDVEYGEIIEAQQEICEAHGLESWDAFVGDEDAPAEWKRLERSRNERHFEMLCEQLGSAGEAELVRDLRAAPEAFRARMAAVDAVVVAGQRLE